jgi:hypothetical protein
MWLHNKRYETVTKPAMRFAHLGVAHSSRLPYRPRSNPNEGAADTRWIGSCGNSKADRNTVVKRSYIHPCWELKLVSFHSPILLLYLSTNGATRLSYVWRGQPRNSQKQTLWTYNFLWRNGSIPSIPFTSDECKLLQLSSGFGLGRESPIVIREETGWTAESLPLSLEGLGSWQRVSHCHQMGWVADREPPIVIRWAGWLTESLPISLERPGGWQRASHCHQMGWVADREPPNIIREAGWTAESLPLSLEGLGGWQRAYHCHQMGWVADSLPFSSERLGGC